MRRDKFIMRRVIFAWKETVLKPPVGRLYVYNKTLSSPTNILLRLQALYRPYTKALMHNNVF